MEEKIGTELNIALDTAEYLREKSLDLNTGYDKDLSQWRLIIRYIGDIEALAMDYSVEYTELLGGFAIVLIDESVIEEFASDSRVIYIEKPKLFFQARTTINGFVESCMNVPFYEYGLKGKGITVAIIDSGIDIYNSVFMDDNGSVTKIVGIWDQTLYGNPPRGYNVGTFYSREDINAALESDEKLFFSEDISGHGTAVAGIVVSCTPEVDLLIIKLDTYDREQSDTISLMLGIDFAVRYSIDNELPMVINLSYGNNSGDHNGNSVLERYIDYVSGISKITFVVGAGNDGVSGRHVQINMENESFYRRDFLIPEGEKGINIQVWRNYQDQFHMFLQTPRGDVIGPFNNLNVLMKYSINDMDIRVLNSSPSPINIKQETYISIIPYNEFIESGIWSIIINPQSIIDGRVDAWLPVEGSTNTNIRFLTPSESTTLTIPSTTDKVITVGAYDSNSMTYASFSGRGNTVDGIVKPDIVAPGVDIDVPAVGGGYTLVSGTSFAAPFVSSAAAMLMEYGIVEGNDMFLYGEKVKSYIISGARQILGISSYPDIRVGWGALCVDESIPKE